MFIAFISTINRIINAAIRFTYNVSVESKLVALMQEVLSYRDSLVLRSSILDMVINFEA